MHTSRESWPTDTTSRRSIPYLSDSFPKLGTLGPRIFRLGRQKVLPRCYSSCKVSEDKLQCPWPLFSLPPCSRSPLVLVPCYRSKPREGLRLTVHSPGFRTRACWAARAPPHPHPAQEASSSKKTHKRTLSFSDYVYRGD